MYITEESRKNITYMKKNLDCYDMTFPKSQARSANDIFKNLYFEIYKANEYVSRKMHSKCFKTHLTKVEVTAQLPQPKMYDSHFFPSKIKKYINTYGTYWLQFSCQINKRKVKVNFVLFEDDTDLKKYKEYVRKIYAWMYLLNYYSLNKCSEQVNIYLYMTPFKKTLPKNQIIVMNPEHVNTAFTTGCSKKTEIIIYREEEWFKVLLHETFHNFGLDFNDLDQRDLNAKISSLFPIKSSINAFEAYCETWARIINCLFACFDVKYKTNIDAFTKCVNNVLAVECNFALYQMVKILEFMGLKYKNLIGTDAYSVEARQHLYREKSNVFAYYIITAVLLFDYPSFLIWCKDNNTSLLRFSRKPSSQDNFFQLIQSNYKTSELMEDIKCMEKKLQKNVKKDNVLYNSTRMTIVEYK